MYYIISNYFVKKKKLEFLVTNFVSNLYLDFYLTYTNVCFKIYAKFIEIGSDIYEERPHKNTNESKR